MAKVLSSISGNLISAASAGYAPTNSGDVSAIASAYQVVSSTGTQLYAGTAYVTSVNGDALSAARAGNAANAVQATSAWYDGTGRLISALPDAAEVSSIASSYAESAASSKLDASAQVVTATAGDGTYVTSINGMGISGEGGGGAQVVTSTGSASATEGWWPVTTSYLVSSINGSALLPYGYSALSGNSANWTYARNVVTANSANWDSVYNTVSSNSATWGQSGIDSATVSAIASSYAESAASSKADSSSLSSYALSSDVSGVIDTVSANSATWGAGASLPITGSAGDETASYEAGRLEFTRYDTAGEPDIRTATMSPDQVYIDYTIDGNDHTSMMLNESMLDFMDSEGDHIVDAYSIDSWNSAVDTVANNSASWGQGAVDSATVSAIASSYAESAVSSKLDSSASSSFYTTANESGYVDSAYVDSAVSGKMDTSAMTSYALSADVSGTVDLVSTQSANWGGSALALSAGPGVKLEMVGNTLVASTDETVLWSGSTTYLTSVTLSEPYTNFDRIRFYWKPWSDSVAWRVSEIPSFSDVFTLDAGWCNTNNSKGLFVYGISSTSHTDFVQYAGGYQNITGANTWTDSNKCYVTKVVGINRTAGV